MPFFPQQIEKRRIVRAKRPYSKGSLKRQLALRTPEVKDVVLSRNVPTLDSLTGGNLTQAALFSNIIQGTQNTNRIGDKIRVLSIEISGSVAGIGGQSLATLICPNNAQRDPQLTDFGDQVGNYYDLSHGWELYRFIRDAASKTVEQGFKYTFPMGMVVSYDPPSEAFPFGQVSKNEVYAVHVNTTNADISGINYTIRIRFVDV